MVRLNKAKIKPGHEYDKYFPEPDWVDVVHKRSADLADTLDLIPFVITKYLDDTKQIVRKLGLKGLPVREACRQLWQFLYDHVPYRKDKQGTEQLRRPARSWFEREKRMDGSPGGVDCDCFTIFIATALHHLNIPCTLRVTRNNPENPAFGHIYPIVPYGNGKYYTLDVVTDSFDYEAPFLDLIDKPMELHYLSGLEDSPGSDGYDDDLYEDDDILDYTESAETVDMEDFFDGMDGDLGFLRKLRKKIKRGVKKLGKTVKKVGKKVIHVVNKLNPVTFLLRNGLLAAMKLNMFKVAERIKYAYLSEADARKRNYDMGRWGKLQDTMRKLEKIFYGAGGKPSNLRKAILSGKGNKNRDVAGLGAVYDGGYYDENSDLRTILGEDIYQDEVQRDLDSIEGLGELGEPATGAALAAASGAVASIAAILNKIGDLKKKGQEVVKDTKALIKPSSPSGSPVTPAPPVPGYTDFTPQPLPSLKPAPAASASRTYAAVLPLAPAPGSKSLPATTGANDQGGEPTDKPGFLDKIKDNPTPWLIGAGVAGLGIYAIAQSSKKKKPKGNLSGIKRKRRKTTLKGKTTGKGKTTRKRSTSRKRTTRTTLSLM